MEVEDTVVAGRDSHEKRRKTSSITSLVAAEEVLGLGILEGAAADDVDPDEDDGGNDERDVGLAPLIAQVAQQPRLAGVAVVAELALVVAPEGAVHVRHGVTRVDPQCRVHVPIATYRRWFAAS